MPRNQSERGPRLPHPEDFPLPGAPITEGNPRWHERAFMDLSIFTKFQHRHHPVYQAARERYEAIRKSCEVNRLDESDYQNWRDQHWNRGDRGLRTFYKAWWDKFDRLADAAQSK